MPRPLDRTDFGILAQLQNDARLSNKELAARVGLAPSSCLERVRRLRDEGALRGFHADVDPRVLGIELQAMIAIRLREHTRATIEAFERELIERPEVSAMYNVGGATDFLVHAAVRNTEHLRDFTLETIASREVVEHIETSIIFSHVRRSALPAYAFEQGAGTLR